MNRLTLFHYYGGKVYMVKHILPLIPPHNCYVEVFGGAGNLLFSKPPSKVEIFNDINENIVNLFRVIRDEQKFKIFKQKIELIPYSRKEFYFFRDEFEPASDVEKAIRFFVLINQSFSGQEQSWSYGIKKNQAKRYFNKIEKLDLIHKRIKNVQLECADFRKILTAYDSEDTFFYCDPPYVPETRKEKRSYKYEMTEADHQDLVEILLRLKGKVILSGYKNKIYEKLEREGWIRKDFHAKLHAKNARNIGKREDRIESLWLSPSCLKSLNELKKQLL